LWYN